MAEKAGLFFGLWVGGGAHGVVGVEGGLGVGGEVAEGDDGGAGLFEVGHEFLEALGGGVHPGVGEVGYAVELEDGEGAGLGLVDYFLEVVEGPFGVGVCGGGDEKGVVFGGVVLWADVNLAIGEFGLHTPSGEFIAEFFEFVTTGGAEGVATPGEGNGFGDADIGELDIDLCEFFFHGIGCGLGVEAAMGPGVVTDFEAHAMNVGDVLPGHEVVGIVHPQLGDEEGGTETVFLEQGCYEIAVGLYGVVESEDDDGRGGSRQGLGDVCAGLGMARGVGTGEAERYKYK